MNLQTIPYFAQWRDKYHLPKFLNLVLILTFLLKFDVGWGQVVTPDCNNSEPCQINAFWNFEQFSSQAEVRATLTLEGSGPGVNHFFISTGYPNTPDFFPGSTPTVNMASAAACSGPSIVESGNATNRISLLTDIFAGSVSSRSEGIAIPLCEPIFPGMSGNINFKAFIADYCISSNYNPKVRFEFTELPPVNNTIIYSNPGIVSDTYKRDLLFSEQTVPTYGGTPPSVEFINNSDFCWNYLIVSG
jgi:hypothetical protein